MVIVAAGLNPIVSYIHGLVVTLKRKPAGVPYPNCYATEEQVKKNPEAYAFNCAQRAHANFLENAPWTAMAMLFAGLTYPRLSAGLGLGWLLFRLAFMRGYVFSGKPGGKGRFQGSLAWPIQFTLYGLAMVTAWKMF